MKNRYNKPKLLKAVYKEDLEAIILIKQKYRN